MSLAPAARLELAAVHWGEAARVAAAERLALGRRVGRPAGDGRGRAVGAGARRRLRRAGDPGAARLVCHCHRRRRISQAPSAWSAIFGICSASPSTVIRTRAAGRGTRPGAKRDWPLRPDYPAAGRAPARTPADAGYPFARIHGSGVYEIPVGPVHAGIIEPGHFRFQAVGEDILSLEARLGYTHKGIEKIAGGRDPAGLARLAGRVSGDSTVAHTWAACLAMERAAGCRLPPRAAVPARSACGAGTDRQSPRRYRRHLQRCGLRLRPRQLLPAARDLAAPQPSSCSAIACSWTWWCRAA